VASDVAPATLTVPAHLREAYARCRAIHREHDIAFYLGCKMLPAAKRPHVDALYAHARLLDQIVDDPAAPAAQAAARLDERLDRFAKALAGQDDGDAVLEAAAHTARLFRIPQEYFRAFGEAMRSDLQVSRYDTFEQLRGYMYGAASLLGLQLVPVLGPTDPRAAQQATNIGYALQMTNILRDVEEDLERGRVYLPLEDLQRFGVSVEDLVARRADGALRELLRFQEGRAPEYYAAAREALGMLQPSSRECVATALSLYSGILDSLAASDYQVFGVRHEIGKLRALRLAAPAYRRARRSWH
jgi:phytoene synthase